MGGPPALQHLQMEEKRAVFLEAIADTLTITGAARIAGISPARVYQWFNEDPHFKELAYQAHAEGKERATQRLEESLYERAIKHDTIGAIFLLKSLRPNTYRDNSPPTQQFNINTLIDQRAQQLVPSNQAPGNNQEPAGNQVIDIPRGSVKSLDLTSEEIQEH